MAGNYFPNYNYQYPTYYKYTDDKSKDLSKKDKKKDKKDDIFDKIIGKIIDKIIKKVTIAVPKIIRSLFGFGLQNKGDYGSYDVGYGNNNFGLFGFIPMFIMKILTTISSFIYKIQKNKFLRSFLIPMLVVGLGAGLMIFLVWWLQPNDSYNNNKQYDNYNSYNSYNEPYENYNYGYKTNENYNNINNDMYGEVNYNDLMLHNHNQYDMRNNFMQ